MVKVPVVACAAVSEHTIAKLNIEATVGVPEITPDELRVSPVGRLPDESAQI
jgi:hypothetical protein